MKKVLFIAALISISLISCNKQEPLRAGKSHEEKQWFNSGNKFTRRHDVYCAAYYNINSTCLSSDGNYDKAKTYMYFEKGRRHLWGLEYLGKYKKFWSQRGYVWERWRALDIDWRNPEYGGATNTAIIDRGNSDPSQEWELIGNGDPDANGKGPAFQGFIVNRKTGQMLEARELSDGIVDVVASKVYKGSEEEQLFKEEGFFYRVDQKYVWIIGVIPWHSKIL